MLAEVATRPARNRMKSRALRTRKKLLDAARAVFAEKGLEAARIEEITERADLGKGTFYNHFSDKGEAMAALVQEAVETLVSRIRGECASCAVLPDLLRAILRAHQLFFAGHRDDFLLLFTDRFFLRSQGGVMPADPTPPPLLANLRQASAAALSPRGETPGNETPLRDDLAEIERLMAPHLVPPADAETLGRLAYAFTGFVSGYFLSFGRIGLSGDDIEKGLGLLPQVFLSSASALLHSPLDRTGPPLPVTAPSPERSREPP
jgi:AcrR family transcriptional regulator